MKDIVSKFVRHTVSHTAVESALVLPFVLLFLFGLTEFGRAIWNKATLDYAVRPPARCAAIH